ncbi:MAG: hypothetical protein ACKVOP_12245 [Sphingomonadaceae bacterium]
MRALIERSSEIHACGCVHEMAMVGHYCAPETIPDFGPSGCKHDVSMADCDKNHFVLEPNLAMKVYATT